MNKNGRKPFLMSIYKSGYMNPAILFLVSKIVTLATDPTGTEQSIDLLLRNIDSSLPDIILADDELSHYDTTLINNITSESETSNILNETNNGVQVTTIENLLEEDKQQSSKSESDKSTKAPDLDNQKCRIYFAESTIPNAGWGIFVGVDVKEGQEISPRGDIVIPLSSLRHTSLLNEYTWSGDTVEHTFALGMSAIPNCFFPLNNIDLGNTYPGYNKLDYNHHYESYNPGLGAHTVHYSDTGAFALNPMEAGSELFLDYGYDYFLDEDRIETKFGLLPFDEDYEIADKMLHGLRNIYNNITGNPHPCQQYQSGDKTDEEATSARTSLNCTNYPHNMSDNIEITDMSIDLYELTKFVITSWPNRVQGALPSEVDGINEILDGVGSTGQNYADRSIHNMEYLEEHGACMDHMYADDSDIPFAGKGAFANKFLPAGSVVAPIPLLHFSRSVLTIYNDADDDDADFDDTSIAQYQLLLNYCLGHNESSIILCPYGMMSSLVNHPGRNQKANVKLAWNHKIMRDPQWLEMPLQEWKNEFHAGLALDYVATRDIEEGEEILLDYGTEWQRAWDRHVRSYPSSTHFKYHILNSYNTPIELPRHDEDSALVMALKNGDDDFQPQLWCRAISVVFHDGFAINHYTANEKSMYHPCRIIDKKRIDQRFQEYTYTAELIERAMDVPQTSESGTETDSNIDNLTTANNNAEVSNVCTERNTGKLLFNVQRDVFLFGSVHLNEYNPAYLETWTFRHDIRIPDEIMPDLWKDLKTQNEI